MFKRLFNLKSNKGVTLVALIITIIVLLILAGVTINAVVGGEGTVEKASEAKNATENSNNKAIVENAVAIAMGKEKGTTLHLDTLTNAVGNVGTVAEEGKYFTVTIQNYKYWVTNTGNVTLDEPIRIGDTINYSTSLNGVTLDNWKVFYEDENYTYIILADYLPNSAVSSTIKTNYNLTNGTGDYSIKSTTNRKDLIDAMTTTLNWSSLLTGTLNGNNIDYRTSTDTNIKAMGSPTLDLYVNSWNTKYSSDTLYIRYVDTGDIDNSNFYATGYGISDTASVTSTIINLSGDTGYNDTLYFPYQEGVDSCYGCWLASPSARHGYNVMGTTYIGSIGNAYYYYDHVAFRPVVCLPSNILQ